MGKNLKELLAFAEGHAASEDSWAELSNFLFNPTDGLITKAFPTPVERADFMQTAEYKAIRALLLERMRTSGLIDGAAPKKSGRFVVRMPKSLHAALEREAEDEGVSLNQLVVTKLAIRLSQINAESKAELV